MQLENIMSRNFKSLSVIMIAFALLATVAAPAYAGGGATSIILTGTSKGPVFTFTVNGELTQAQLNSGFLRTPSRTYPLTCVQKDATTVKCTAPKKAAGDPNGTVVLAGFGSYVAVPQTKEGPAGYCYGVFDLGEDV